MRDTVYLAINYVSTLYSIAEASLFMAGYLIISLHTHREIRERTQLKNDIMKKSNLIIGAGVLAAAGAAATVLALKNRKGIPDGAVPVSPFDASKYLGTWYEIARHKFKFEHGLIKTTAHYSLNDDGSIKVVNRGYDPKKGKWSEAEGKALFRGDKDVAMLKVSFFGPFYTGYNVVELDDNYKYALVMGKNTKYLWLLSREKSMPEKIKKQYLAAAEKVGYDLSKLVWVKH